MRLIFKEQDGIEVKPQGIFKGTRDNFRYLSYSTLAIGKWRSCRSGKSGPVPGGNCLKFGGQTDTTKFPSLLCPLHQPSICCYFPLYLISRRLAKVE
jgi:hypothetical protein